MGLLDNKIALVTGGSRGIGSGIVEKFAKEGAKVAFTYRSSAEKANALEQQLSEMGVYAKGFQSDAASYADAEELIKQVIAEFGQIDVLVNNAGVTKDNLLLRMTEEQWQQVIHTNLNSVFNLTKHALRPMLRKRTGSIINLSSVVGVGGNAGQANYAASKAGIIGFSKSVAQEVGSRSIRCNVIAPGFIETDMTEQLSEEVKNEYQKKIPLKRFGSVEEVANVALFLASDLSTYVSGQVLHVCGAMS